MLRRANPNKETTDWRAVCGKTACTVRRAGKMRVFPDPYQLQFYRKGAGDSDYHIKTNKF